MKTIARYVTGSFLTAFVLAWMVLTFVLSIGLLVKVTGLIAKGMPVAVVTRYFLTGIPETLGFTIPLAVLISALLVFGRLSADGEISAMRACGINVLQIMFWPLCFGLLMSACCLYINSSIMPRAMESRARLSADATSEMGLDMMEPGKFNDGPGNLKIWFARRDGDWLMDVLMFDRTTSRTNALNREIRAQRAHVIRRGNDLLLDMYDVWIDPFYEDRPGAAAANRITHTVVDAFKPANRPRKVRNYTLPELFRRLAESEAMASDAHAAEAIVRACPDCNRLDAHGVPLCVDPVHQLARDWCKAAPLDDPGQIARLKQTCPACAQGTCQDPAHVRYLWAAGVRRAVTNQATEIRVELHKRLALACAAFCFALIGMPLGIRAHRRESTIGIAMALGIALAFYLAMILADAFKLSPALHPHLIVWIPVVFCLGLAAILVPRNQ